LEEREKINKNKSLRGQPESSVAEKTYGAGLTCVHEELVRKKHSQLQQFCRPRKAGKEGSVWKKARSRWRILVGDVSWGDVRALSNSPAVWKKGEWGGMQSGERCGGKGACTR
jgi:hypothetical protein